MRKALGRHKAVYEKAMALAMAEIAGELRLIDAINLVAYLHNGQFANIKSLVNSSAERFFKKGTIDFSSSGEAVLSWGAPPKIALDMQFRHMQVDVHFRIFLEAQQAGVEIHYISLGGDGANHDQLGPSLEAAIADARLLPIPGSAVC